MQFRFTEDERFPAWKIAFLQYAIAAAFLVLGVGYWRLQIGHHNLYVEQAERNRIRSLPIIAPRGRILDREGRVLVDNSPAFIIMLLRESASAITPARLEGIARGLQLNPLEVTRLVESSSKLPGFQPIILKQLAQLEDISFVESHRTEYPELATLQVQQRLYPQHTAAAAMLGYVGEVSPEVLAKPDSPYRPGDAVGKSGVERAYNTWLSGKDGMRRVVVNSRGQEVGSMTQVNAVSGHDLRLSIDLDLQAAAESALGDRIGGIVALDPRNGDVLAMVSHPTFDPNVFARHVDKDTWDQLTSDPAKPLMNKAIQAQLAPGSVFKIFTGAAALETGTVKPRYTIYCPGAVTIYGHTYHDWTFDKGKGHGSVDFHNAIVHSCDVYFYTVGKLLGIDKIAYFAKSLGLGSRTGIDLPSEDTGVIPSPEWVEKVFKRKWWAGETISVAIGQGAVAVTPLQLAYGLGGIAWGGDFYRPHVVFRDQLSPLPVSFTKDAERRFPLSDETVDTLTKGMWGVVNEGGGTGAGARCPGIDIAGKTGTAQVVSEGLRKSNRNAAFKNNAWFVGFSPSTKPEIIVATLVMEGEHSAVAAPIVRDVIKAYYDKKQGHNPSSDQTQTALRLTSQSGQAKPLGPELLGRDRLPSP